MSRCINLGSISPTTRVALPGVVPKTARWTAVPLMIVPLLAALLLTAATTPAAYGQASAYAFTYQGELKQGESAVNADAARLCFRLFLDDQADEQIGSDCVVASVAIVNGIFTALVDFGPDVIIGDFLWLQVGVDVSGGTNYTWMTPLTRITSTPYAAYSLRSADAVWQRINGGIFFTGGKVGIGTTSPSYMLQVHGSGMARVISGLNTEASGSSCGVFGQSNSTGGQGVRGTAQSATGACAGVFGDSNSPDGSGVSGVNGNATGATRGVRGQVVSPDGAGVLGWNSAASGNGIGIFGLSDSPTGFGGYFAGRGYFSGPLGIGVTNPSVALDVAGTAKVAGLQLTTTPQTGFVLTSDAHGNATWQAPAAGGIGGSGTANYIPKFAAGTTLANSVIYESAGGNVGIGTYAPSQKLHVIGSIRATGLQIPINPQAGHVLTSDAAGTATWQAPTGGSEFTLPYSGSVSHTGAAFSVTNSGTGISSSAISGRIDNPASHSDVAAGTFMATGTNGMGIAAYGDAGPSIYGQYSGTGNYAFYGTSSGAGGGFFRCSRIDGVGVLAQASGTTGTGLLARATGTRGTGLLAEATGSSGVGLMAKGPVNSAQFYGNVAIYEYGTTNKVLELGKGLDYAEGFDVSGDLEDVGPGSVLVIDPANPGRLTVSRAAYDRRVAGIVAGANGLGSGVRLGAGQFDHDVALAGRVYCNVIAVDDDVVPGDLLTTAERPGYAMEAIDTSRSAGAILGKAMEPLARGETGRILVLVTLQ